MILIADSSALIALAHCDCLEILEGLLGSGEMEAMALYKKLNADWLLIDDEKARKTARFNKIKVIGSLGVLLLAKEKNLIQKKFYRKYFYWLMKFSR